MGTNMKIIKLDNNHKDQFYNFVNFELVRKKLLDDPQWNSIEYVRPGRDIYACLDENDNFLMTVASNDTPVRGMPWRYGDTQISASGRSFFQNKDVIIKLNQFMLEDCEAQGIWGHWFIADARKRTAYDKGNHTTDIVKEKVGRYVMPYIKAYENYNLADVALVKANCKSGVPLYDWFLKEPVNTDRLIRFASAKFQWFRDSTPTYG